MKKRIFSLLMAIGLAVTGINPVFAAKYYDLTELETLMQKCEAKGIPVDYERVNYEVLKKFEAYLNQDEQYGVDSEQLNFNREKMDELYNEARDNMTAYLNGKKRPFKVDDYDIGNIKADGNKLVTESGKSVYSIGYVGWGTLIDDIDKFHDMGANNIEIELSPLGVTSGVEGWELSPVGDSEIAANETKNYVTEGERSLKIENTSSNALAFVRQAIPCEPNTTYEFGMDCRGTNVNKLWISLSGTESDRQAVPVTSIYRGKKFTYTTGKDETYLMMFMLAEGTGKIYIDNVYVKKQGTEENLLKNGGFENDTDLTAEASWKLYLEKAKQYGIGVSLLIGAQYFPDTLPSEVYSDNPKARVNINAPEAREYTENALRTILSHFQNLPSVVSVILTNEPAFDTHGFPDFYTPKYREYLKSVHSDISTLNSKWGTSYSSFDEIEMPEVKAEQSWEPAMYDWVQFNDVTFAQWHKWLAGIVKEYLPDTPVHTKTLEYIPPWNDDGSDVLVKGTDYELFEDFSDWSGLDAFEYTTIENEYYSEMLLYDYMDSISEKPIYNSEDHMIPDRLTEFSDKQRRHVRNHLWQGAVHGKDMSSIWVWDRSYDAASDLNYSILHRPDCVAETGKTALDMNRLSEYITALNETKPEVALFYSKPSRMNDSNTTSSLNRAYKALMNCGLRVGIVSDYSIDNLNQYKYLVIPRAQYCTEKTLKAVESFIDGGGKVIMCSNSFAYDEYKNRLSNSSLKEKAETYSWISDKYTDGYTASEITKFFNNEGMIKVKVCDSNGNIPEGIEWESAEYNGHTLVNVTSLAGDLSSLHIEVNGEKLSGAVNKLKNEKIEDTFDLTQYTPILLEYGAEVEPIEPIKPDEVVNRGITSLRYEDNSLKWDYSGDEYYGASIYGINSDGLFQIGKTDDTAYSGIENTTVFVRAINSNGTEGEGKILSVFDTKPITAELSNVKVGNENVNYSLSLKNNANVPVKGVAVIQFTRDGVFKKNMLVDLMLRAGAEDKMDIGTIVDADSMSVTVYDSKECNNALSENVNYTFIN